MPKNIPKLVFWLTMALAGAAVVASAILLVDYVRPAAVFCGPTGGCGSVRHTVFAYPLGVPLPAIGLSGIFAVALAALVPGRAARIAQAVLAGIAGAVALLLFGVQARMGVLCPYCAVVDSASIVLAALSIARAVRGWDPPEGRAPAAASIAGLVLAGVVPAAIGFARKPPPVVVSGDVPPVIADEIRATGAGKVTVVDFVDFECPFCRMTHTELAPLLAARKGKIRLARKHVPLRMHPHALDAARAGCCAELLGKGDEVADALFTADPKDLTSEGCEKIAKEKGLDVDRFRACVRDPATDARIQKDGEAFRASGGHGLPTIWVDGVKLAGAQDQDTLKATLDAAIRRL